MELLALDWIASLDVEQDCLGGCNRRVQGPVLCDACFARQAVARAKPTWDAVRERIPARLRWARFESCELAARVARPDAVREARDAVGCSALFVGPSRAGKSSLAAATFAELLGVGSRPNADQRNVMRAIGLRWVTGIQLCAAARQHALGSGTPPEIEFAISASVLVIDDLGAEIDGAACSQVVFERCDANRPLVATTGLTRKELGQKYGAGIMERLCEGAVIAAGKAI